MPGFDYGAYNPGNLPKTNTHFVKYFQEIGEPSDFALLFRNVALAEMHQGWA
jgi:hypothetical protein